MQVAVAITGSLEYEVGLKSVKSIDVSGPEEGAAIVIVKTETERLELCVPWGLLITSEKGWQKKGTK